MIIYFFDILVFIVLGVLVLCFGLFGVYILVKLGFSLLVLV